MKKRFFTIVVTLFIAHTVCAQTAVLKNKIEEMLKGKNATVGVGIFNPENKESLYINENEHFPLMSVFKFHIALATLDKVDKKQLSLKTKIFIKKEELLLNTYSPFRDKYPNGNVSTTIAEIITYIVSQSDNNLADILLKHIGGTKVVNDYIHSIGIKDVAIIVNEKDMHGDWNVQYGNWTTPVAATDLLKIFKERKLLSKKNSQFLIKVMTETQTGLNRIKGQLPKGTVVAHKTGSSDTKDGLTAGFNDIGIVALPNGKWFAVSVLIKDSKENDETNAKIISDISKTAWDYFTGNKL